jgi:hypothetical protein
MLRSKPNQFGQKLLSLSSETRTIYDAKDMSSGKYGSPYLFSWPHVSYAKAKLSIAPPSSREYGFPECQVLAPG